jgi:PAS domain S-box-containing protein
MTTHFSAAPHVLEAIFTQMPDALIFADCEGVIRLWNGGAASVFGFSAEEAVGESLDLIIPERFRPAHWRAYQLAVERRRTGAGDRVRTTRATHKDGRRLFVELSFGIVTDAEEKVLGAIALGRDCSERYALEKAMKERLARLEAGPA